MVPALSLSDPPTEMDCNTVKSTRRRTRAEVAADPIRKHTDARFKLRVIEYAKAYSVRAAARKFNVSAGSISGRNGWEAKEEELRRKAHRLGGHVKGAH